MALSRLLIRDFRNIASADLSLAANFNILIGDNGSGKTSILEAIYTLGHGRTFRGMQSIRVIRHERPEFILHGKIEIGREKRSASIGLSRNRMGQSIVNIDGKIGRKVAELAQLLPIQLISPESSSLLEDGPRHRRAFMDWGCFHNEPGFFSVWSTFRRLLKQRNAALRQVNCYRQLRVWDKELINIAYRISEYRAKYSAAISKEIANICLQFLPEFHLNFSFQRGWNNEKDFGEILESQFDRDRTLNYTTLGPHKADFRIHVQGVPAEYVLSRGQMKLLICALRLAQGEFLANRCGRYCIYLIDDFASELDGKHRRLLAERLRSICAQVFVSALSTDQVRDIAEYQGKTFKIEKGAVSFQ